MGGLAHTHTHTHTHTHECFWIRQFPQLNIVHCLFRTACLNVHGLHSQKERNGEYSSAGPTESEFRHRLPPSHLNKLVQRVQIQRSKSEIQTNPGSQALGRIRPLGQICAHETAFVSPEKKAVADTKSFWKLLMWACGTCTHLPAQRSGHPPSRGAPEIYNHRLGLCGLQIQMVAPGSKENHCWRVGCVQGDGQSFFASKIWTYWPNVRCNCHNTRPHVHLQK